MPQRIRQIIVLAALAGASFAAYPQVAPAETRGQLLYATHCISCHTTQMHWRNDKQAYDWNSLKVQVCAGRAMQACSGATPTSLRWRST